MVLGNERESECRHESDGEFEDGSRVVVEVGQFGPTSALWSFSASGLGLSFSSFPRLSSSCSPYSLSLSFLKEHFVDQQITDTTVMDSSRMPVKPPALMQKSSRWTVVLRSYPRISDSQRWFILCYPDN